MQDWGKYADFYKESGYSAFPQEHRHSLGEHCFDLIRVKQGAHTFSDPAVDETILALPTNVEKGCTWAWQIANRQHRERAEPGRMVVVPAGVESKWAINGNREILMLVLPSSTVRSVLGSNCPSDISAAFSALSEASWSDPLLRSLLLRVWDCAAGREAVDRCLSDGLLISIVSQLFIRSKSHSAQSEITSIPYWRLQRVLDFVDNNLNKDITLQDLANAAGFSCRHFARSFSLQTGETPHRWVMKQRLERAKKLLKETDFSLSDISDSCGFSSQSHMTTLMKSETGTTPRQWRCMQQH